MCFGERIIAEELAVDEFGASFHEPESKKGH